MSQSSEEDDIVTPPNSRAPLLGALDRVPRSSCHFDVHPANRFGEDDGNLVPDPVLDFHLLPEHIDDLYERLVRGYTTGLRQVGWYGPESMPRAAMAAEIGAKYAWIAPELERAIAERREMLNRRPLDEAVMWWKPAVALIEERTREACALLGIS